MLFPSPAVFDGGSSVSSSLRVQQTPADMNRLPGGSANISCSHSIPSYDRILWYKQQGAAMQLLGYMNVMFGNLEPGVNVTISGSAQQGQTCTLSIRDLSLSSSAVYFCAASYHSATSSQTSVQKPLWLTPPPTQRTPNIRRAEVQMQTAEAG